MARRREVTSNNGHWKQSTTAPAPGDDWESRVARRAYERWQTRGCPQGDDLRDWLEAELELAQHPGGTSTVKGERR